MAFDKILKMSKTLRDAINNI